MITRFTMYFSFQRTELCCERLKRRFFWGDPLGRNTEGHRRESAPLSANAPDWQDIFGYQVVQ